MCERLQGRTQTLRALKYGRRCGGSACMRSSPKECVVCSHDLWKATPAMGVCTDQSKCKHSGESRARTGPLHSVSSAQCQGELQRCCHPAGAARFEVEAALRVLTCVTLLPGIAKKIAELPFLTSDNRPQNKLPRYRQVGSLFALSLPPLSRRTALQTLRSAAARPRRADGRSVSPRPAGGRCPKRRDKLFDKCLLFVESCRRYIAINA